MKIKKTTEKTVQETGEDLWRNETFRTKKLLKKAIESENYEKASKIRDEINKRGNN